jgi:TorA maturation chaperone TorD
MEISENTRLYAQKSVAYRALALLFLKPPDQQSADPILAWPILESADPDLRDAFTLLSDAFHRIQEDFEEAARIAEEFQLLFEGPAHLAAPPWESVYRTRERILFGPTTLEVREVYRRAGLALAEEGKEPEDHVSLELTFLADLCDRVAASGSDPIWIIAYKDFLTKHLSQWIPAFTDEILIHAQTDFYQGLARLLRAIIQVETACSIIQVQGGISDG